MDLLKIAKKQWDRVLALGLTIAGAFMLISGWIGVSGTAVLSQQAPYIVSGAVGGMFLLGVGATLWISADLRDEWRKLDRIEQALGDGVLRWDGGASSSAAPARSATEVEVLSRNGATTPRAHARSQMVADRA
jgi:hypothetical protein